jgi:hypothetical protein
MIVVARFYCTVPSLGVSVDVTDIKLIKNSNKISYVGNQLSGMISNGLSEDNYDKISKQARILYSFCFEDVYPESYDINEPNTSFGVAGHDERKEHLLRYSGNPRDAFKKISTSLFEDLLHLELGQKDRRQLFNLMFIWARAHELEDLKLMVEAYTQYWRILDLITAKGSKADAIKLLKKLGLAETKSNIAAAKIEQVMRPTAKKYSRDNIETIAYLDSLRHPHAHKPSRSEDYYLEEKVTHLDAEMNNIFIADITRLYILWSVGLKDYYLKPRANIYELAKREPSET